MYILAASQTRDKDALTQQGVKKVLDELSKDFDFIVCDSPAGIEKGAQMALYFADEANTFFTPCGAGRWRGCMVILRHAFFVSIWMPN